MDLYHVLNRGVEKRTIFLDGADRLRFTHGLEIFNDTRPVENSVYFFSRATQSIESIDLRGRYKKKGENPTRKPIIDIHGWCLMNNHYHLLVSERVENGLTRFLMKLNVGYAKYFNKRYERSGTLFEGRTKKIHVASDSHFLHILLYIHLNPLDFLRGAAQWRDLRITNEAAALKHLEQYRWSSFLDYCNKRNFPSILTRDLFDDVFPNYKKSIVGYIKDFDIEPIRDFILE